MLEAKAKAILKAFGIAQTMQAKKILTESDYNPIVYAILGFSLCPWSIITIVEDIKIYLEEHASILIY